MTAFFLPIPEIGTGAVGTQYPGEDGSLLPLAGGLAGFRVIRPVHRDGEGAARLGSPVLAVECEDPAWGRIRHRVCARRRPFCGVSLAEPVLMGIVNVTPDSFSDGGRHPDAGAAALHGKRLAEAGAGIVDFGGESTRPGAGEVSEAEEIRRVLPAIEQFRELCPDVPVSIDTRKAEVARRALAAGAGIVNDVSGLARDPDMIAVVLDYGAFACVMHSQGEPAVMQRAPRYRSALLDVYEWLADRVERLVAEGVDRNRIAVDPGIGFGKAFRHNMEILGGLALYHGMGCPLLVGASRKRFLGHFSGGKSVTGRLPGSVAGAMHAVASGAQILRVHDVEATAQALDLWRFFNRTGDV